MIRPFIALLLATLLPFTAIAEEIERASINYKGTDGYFFSEEKGDQLLLKLKELEVAKKKISLFDERLEINLEHLKLKQDLVDVSTEISKKWKEAFELEHGLRLDDRKAYEKIIAKKNAWYNSPVFWLMIGLIVGGGLAVGMAFGINEAKEN